jgi:hypothetical protein
VRQCSARAVALRPERDDVALGLERPMLPAWYLDDGNVTYGYALTAHAVQGSTVDRTFALGAERTYAQEGYVIASRARRETRFYLAAYQDDAGEQPPGPPAPPPNAIVRFAEHLSESRQQELAIDEPARASVHARYTAAARGARTRGWRAGRLSQRWGAGTAAAH